MLLTGSDFTNPEKIWSMACRFGPPPKRWDLIYVCVPSRDNEIRKSWDLARACMLKLCDELGLRVLLVGHTDFGGSPGDGIELRGVLPQKELLECIARSRVAFFPNIIDPSPRVISQALCLDVPILVNRSILGGWHYVTASTGRFFEDESDVVAGAHACLTDSFEPLAWFRGKHGPENSSRRLARLLSLVRRQGDDDPGAEVGAAAQQPSG